MSTQLNQKTRISIGVFQVQMMNQMTLMPLLFCLTTIFPPHLHPLHLLSTAFLRPLLHPLPLLPIFFIPLPSLRLLFLPHPIPILPSGLITLLEVASDTFRSAHQHLHHQDFHRFTFRPPKKRSHIPKGPIPFRSQPQLLSLISPNPPRLLLSPKLNARAASPSPPLLQLLLLRATSNL